MYYYATLNNDDIENIEIVGITTSPSPLEYGYCITKQQARELVQLIKNPNIIVKVKENYQEDFKWTVEDRPELDKTKNYAKIAVRDHYNRMMNSVAIFEMYNVMMINNELAANGYFITESNREEKYIDIINSGDENLITLLQTYLEMKDRIDPMWEYYNKVKEFETTVKNMETVEEVNKSLDNLLSYIN